MSMQSIPRERTKNEILHIANRRFAEHGYHGVTFQAIANELGLTKSSIFFHYKNKETLACAAIQSLINTVTTDITRAVYLPGAEVEARKYHFSQSIQSILTDRVELLAPIFIMKSDSALIRKTVKNYFESWYNLFKKVGDDYWGSSALMLFSGNLLMVDLCDPLQHINHLAEVLKNDTLSRVEH